MKTLRSKDTYHTIASKEKDNVLREKKFNFKKIKTKKINNKKGFINIFAAFLLVFILEISIVLVNEGITYKTQISSYERDLKFDYCLEAYYLILNMKFTSEEIDSMVLTPYGSLKEYKLIGNQEFALENRINGSINSDSLKNLNYYIKLEKESFQENNTYILKGYKKGKKREEYIIHESKDLRRID